MSVSARTPGHPSRGPIWRLYGRARGWRSGGVWGQLSAGTSSHGDAPISGSLAQGQTTPAHACTYACNHRAFICQDVLKSHSGWQLQMDLKKMTRKPPVIRNREADPPRGGGGVQGFQRLGNESAVNWLQSGPSGDIRTAAWEWPPAPDTASHLLWAGGRWRKNDGPRERYTASQSAPGSLAADPPCSGCHGGKRNRGPSVVFLSKKENYQDAQLWPLN